MVALGQPGAGEVLLARHGFVDVRRVDVPCVWEFADTEHFARAIAATGPAYEALQASGEQAFHELATSLAAKRLRDGLPLRAEIAVVGYVATRPGSDGAGWDG